MSRDNLNFRFLFLVTCFYLILQSSSYQFNGQSLRNLLVLNNDAVIVGSNTHLYKLGSTLNEEISLQLSEVNRLLLQINNTNLPEDILSCQESSCLLVGSQTLSNSSVTNPSLTSVLFPGQEDLSAIFTGNLEFFVARKRISSQTISSSITKFSYSTMSNLQLNIVGEQREANVFTDRDFLTNFHYNSFVYYVFILRGTSIHVARVCISDPGIEETGERFLTTYTEVQLECSGISNSAKSVATFLEYNGDPIILISGPGLAIGSNIICSFNVTLIDEVMDEKLDNCKNGIGQVNLNRNSKSSCPAGLSNSQKQQINSCNRPGSVSTPLEVDTSISGSNIKTFSSSITFQTINAISYANVVYVFAGNNDGTIEQFYFSNPSGTSLEHIRSINTNDIASVDDIHFSEDGESFYSLTSNTVIKRPIDICSEYTTCESCIASRDPICGWCTLSSLCTKLTNCTTSPQVWQTDRANCPIINSVNPVVIYTDQLTDTTLRLTMNVTNIPEVAYDCVYKFESAYTSKPLTANRESNDTIRCPLPPTNDLPTFTEDTIAVNVSLRTAQEVDVISLTTEQQVAFTNCSIRTTCSSCLSTQRTCMWCPLDNNCISPHKSCTNNITGSPENSCPLIQPPNRLDTLDYLIHSNMSYSLVIRAKNLHIFNSDTFFCTIKDQNRNILYQISGHWNETTVNCMETLFNVSLDPNTSLFEAILEVLFIDGQQNRIPIENLNNSKAIFYSCPLMGENCGQCLHIQSKFQCGYCPDKASCILGSLCSQTTLMGIDAIGSCERPVILSFSPTAGHIDGGTVIQINGTNLGADASQIKTIKIESVVCDFNRSTYDPGKRIECTTQPSITGLLTSPLKIEFTFITITSTQQYKYLIPAFTFPPAIPKVGPLSGGTRVTIMGHNFGIGNNRSIILAGGHCDIVNKEDITEDSTNITCITRRSNMTTIRGQGAVIISIDSHPLYAVGFDYENDPVFTDIQPNFFFLEGGTVFTISGQDLNTVREPQLLIYLPNSRQPIASSNCYDIEDIRMKCRAPSVTNSNVSVDVIIGLKMDNVQQLLNLNVSLTVHQNPIFMTNFMDEIQPGNRKNLTITGSGFTFNLKQVQVTADALSCTPVRKTDTNLICEIEVPAETESGQDYSVVVTLGFQTVTVGSLTIKKPINLLVFLIPGFLAPFIFFIVIFIVIVSIFYRKFKQKDEQNDRLLFELERLESSVAHECKLGFAELQTDLDELTGDLTGSRLPYQNLTSYILQSLFPGAKDHPTLHPPQFPVHKKAQMENGIKSFYSLLLDKTVLLTIVHALESQRQFSIRDKSHVGSLLILALHDRLDYATEILKRLLSELVRRTVAESYPKLLLRRTESVAEKMLSSWLAFTLHGYVVEHTGQPLYLLYKAVKAQLEKGPIDVITGEARYSLSEQKLIRQQLDVVVINATVETEDGLQIPVKLLDCDSVSQAKEKMLDAVYKNAPVSQRPPLTTIDIEYRKSAKECLILRDEDGTNIMEYGWRKINTLGHYWVPDRAIFRLVERHEHAGPGKVLDYTGSLMISHGHRTRTLSDGEDGTRIWHLFKQMEEDPRSSPFMSKKMVTEIYLPRMLSTKTILQQFVDNLFNSIFTLSHPPTSPSQLYTPVASTFPHSFGNQLSYAPGSDSLPVAIKYLFDMLDDEALSSKILDEDVVHTWKNNSLALRFWVNLIKNPEFVFDINKSAIVDACLSVIAQAFIDGCSSSDTRPTINSPTSKLLYNKEVQGYKASVKLFYERIQELPRVPEDMMMQYLRELSASQAQLFKRSQEFNIDSAVYEILRYAIKYRDPILNALRESGLEAKAQIFESVLHCTM